MMSIKNRLSRVAINVKCWCGLHDWKEHHHKKTGFYREKCRYCPAVRTGNEMRLKRGDIFALRKTGFLRAVIKRIFGQ